MRALLSIEPGGAEKTLVLGTLPELVPEPGKLLFNAAFRVNFSDVLAIEDRCEVKPAHPFTRNGEIAGTVRPIGDGSFAIAERVVATKRRCLGPYEQVVVDLRIGGH